jgi:hypothetical protein
MERSSRWLGGSKLRLRRVIPLMTRRRHRLCQGKTGFSVRITQPILSLLRTPGTLPPQSLITHPAKSPTYPMVPEPDQLTTEISDKEYCSAAWASLPWTAWIPFTAPKEEFRQIPKEPGLYRLRATGQDALMYIGETRRPLHQRLQDLRMELRNTDLMPWSDPHAEAPALWAWQNAEGCAYECSAAPLDASVNSRQGMERYLLYRYRQESGKSPVCNFGRFHPRYRKSTTRAENLRGGKLKAGQDDNPAGAAGLPPLSPAGTPGEPDWMRLRWSSHEVLAKETVTSAPAGPGLYMLFNAGSPEIASIGQAGNCQERLLEHVEKFPDEKERLFSFHALEKTVLPHQRKELETDLIGNFFEQNKKAPEYQFRTSR